MPKKSMTRIEKNIQKKVHEMY